MDEQVQTFHHQHFQPTHPTKETKTATRKPGPTKTSLENIFGPKRNPHRNENTLSICTHNIRGINKETDQDTLIQYLIEENIDIIGLSETKLNSTNGDWAFKNYRNKFKCFSSTSPIHPQGSGVTLLVEKEMAKHVYSVKKIEGHIIAITLLFKQNRIMVMQVYLPSNKKESNHYQRLIRSIINEESKHNNSKIIVMGDFNAVMNPAADRPNSSVKSHRWKPEAEIFYFLEDWGFTDIHNLWEMEMPSPTWHSSRSHSRIDYIWVSDNIATNNIHSFSNKKIYNVTESDHTLLTIKLFRKNLADLTKQKTGKTKGSTVILDTSGTTNEQWQDFQDKIERQLKGNIVWEKMASLYYKILSEPDLCKETTQAELQEIWSLIENVIKQTAWKTLKKKKIRNTKRNEGKELRQPREIHNLRSARYLLKLIRIKGEGNKTENSLTDLNKICKDINRLNKNCPELHLTNYSITHSPTLIPWTKWAKELEGAIISLKDECYKKENLRKKNQIKKAIEKRCFDYKENQKRMISSLTDRKRHTVKLDRIVIQENDTSDTYSSKYISTDPNTIKQQTEKFYQKAFSRRKANFNKLDNSWKDQYNPINSIDQEWYKDLLIEPTTEKINKAIRDLPNNKASGPSEISYEMLKKLGTKGKKIIAKFYHICFTAGTTPLSWKKSNLYPIPKKNDWNGDLANTRPIVLLETTRKLFTKIITSRLSHICKREKILKRPNFAGLPGESTAEPIQLINNICEDARENNKELWILFQDTAKAFDTVNLEMLSKAMKRIKIPNKAITLIIDLFKDRQLSIILADGLTNPITAGDGLDQGETISPLLWRIFYDPLMCKIQDNKDLGYNTECTW